MDKFIVGGETLYSRLVEKLLEKYHNRVEIYNEYGPTESTVGCTVYNVNSYNLNISSSVPIGKPTFGNNIYILNDYGGSVPIGGIGEIFIAGESVSQGYMGDAVLTNEKFSIDPFCNDYRMYQTGDLGKLLPNGNIVYIGRKDRQKKIRGYLVDLDDIERCLLSFSLISAAAVIVRQSMNRDENVIIAYYCAANEIDKDILFVYLQQHLPDYMLPTHVQYLSNIPVNKNGKIDYSKLPDLPHEREKSIIYPSNDLESCLFDIWSKILNISKDNLSIKDDFFSLGGDSIIAMQILSESKNAGITFFLKDIFQNRTIASLAKRCQLLHQSDMSADALYVEAPLTPIQMWFFEQNFLYPSYFNMVYLFILSKDINLHLLEEALKMCIKNHKMLRTSFKNVNGSVVQIITSYDRIDFKLEQVDLTDLSESEHKDMMLKLTEEKQNAFKLDQAPLFRAIVFRLKKNEMKLFLVAHHLVIDGVSWRILIEDIERFYKGEKQLPLSNSYFIWSHFLKTKINKSNLDVSYWKNIELGFIEKVVDAYEQGSYFEQQIVIGKEETSYLLLEATQIFGASFNEILLGIFGSVVSDFFKKEQFLISSEGHGRNCFQDMNFYRTIGWFTTIYPMLFNYRQTLRENINFVKESFKKIEGKELNFAIFKYFYKDAYFEKLDSQVLFNYFGRVTKDQLSSDSKRILGNCEQLVAHTSHSKNHLPHPIEVNAIIIDNQLRLSILTDTVAVPISQAKKMGAFFREKIYAAKKDAG